MRVSVTGLLSADLGYVVNVKTIDAIVDEALRAGPAPGGHLVAYLWRALSGRLPARVQLCGVEVCSSPRVRYSTADRVGHMLNLTCQFEFSAAHRLYVAALSEEENRREFGKCIGLHGHNYVLEVTVVGVPDAVTGEVYPSARLLTTVKELVVDQFDHACLNVDVSDFATLNPTVENLAAVTWRLLDGKFAPASLQRVRVYETPKIWADVTRAPE